MIGVGHVPRGLVSIYSYLPASELFASGRGMQKM